MFDWSGFEFGFGPGVTPSQAISAPDFYAPAPVVIPDPTQPVNVLGPPVVPDPTKPVNVLGPTVEQIAAEAAANVQRTLDENNARLRAEQEAQAEQARRDQERMQREFEEMINLANQQEADEDAQLKAEIARLDAEALAERERQQSLFDQEQARLAEEAAARNRIDTEGFARAQSELDALFQQEREAIAKQASEYAAAQDLIQKQAEQARAMAEEQQRMLSEERAQAEAESARVAERGRKTLEEMQREGAEREVARRRVARSTVARPLLGGLAEEESGPQKLGYGGAFGGGGRLAGAQTLGVG